MWGNWRLRCTSDNISNWVIQANVKGGAPERPIKDSSALIYSAAYFCGGFPYDLGEVQVCGVGRVVVIYVLPE